MWYFIGWKFLRQRATNYFWKWKRQLLLALTKLNMIAANIKIHQRTNELVHYTYVT